MRLLFIAVVWFLLMYVFVTSFGAGGLGPMGSISIIVGTGALVFLLIYGVGVRWNRANNAGVSMLHAGEGEAALRAFQQAMGRAWLANHRFVAQYNLGVTHLAVGNLDEAIRELLVVEKKRGLKFMPAYDMPLPNQLALAFALRGNIPEAKTWLAEVVVLCRDGHFAAAAKLPMAKAKEAEAMSVRHYKLARLIEAFSLHQLDPVAHAAAVSEAVGAARPFDSKMAEAVTQYWPELRAFIHSRQVASPIASAA